MSPNCPVGDRARPRVAQLAGGIDSGPLCNASQPVEPVPAYALLVCLSCSRLAVSPPGCDCCSLSSAACGCNKAKPLWESRGRPAPGQYPLLPDWLCGSCRAGCRGMRGPGLVETPHLQGGASQKLSFRTAAPPLQSAASSQRGRLSPSRPPPRRAQPEPAPTSSCSRG